MPEQIPQEEMNKALFVNLVMMFASAAMQQMGKLANPMTGKTEMELEMAQQSIDLLVMLEAKTKGNLDKEEARLIKDSLSSLQLTYVETAAQAPKKEPAPVATPGETAAEPPPTGEIPADKKPPREDPKYHKSYG